MTEVLLAPGGQRGTEPWRTDPGVGDVVLRASPSRSTQGPAEGTELLFPRDSVVVLAGIPGAGKSTLLRRLFPAGDPRVLDSADVRRRWAVVLSAVPYAVWRPLVHLAYYARVRRAIRSGGPLVVHDCGTRAWARGLIGRAAVRAGLTVHLVLLDVPEELARQGQRDRNRVVLSRSMTTHLRRWPGFVEQALAAPGRAFTGARSATVLDRRQADRLTAISFGPARLDEAAQGFRRSG